MTVIILGKSKVVSNIRSFSFSVEKGILGPIKNKSMH